MFSVKITTWSLFGAVSKALATSKCTSKCMFYNKEQRDLNYYFSTLDIRPLSKISLKTTYQFSCFSAINEAWLTVARWMCTRQWGRNGRKRAQENVHALSVDWLSEWTDPTVIASQCDHVIFDKLKFIIMYILIVMITFWHYYAHLTVCIFVILYKVSWCCLVLVLVIVFCFGISSDNYQLIFWNNTQCISDVCLLFWFRAQY